MNRRILDRLTAGLAALFGAALFAAALWPVMPPEPPAVSTAGSAPAQPKTAQMPPADHERMAERILARPLFRADRRPDATLAIAGTTGGRAAPLPKLTGVTLAPSGATAIFQPDGAGKPIMVGEGGVVAGWTVRSISARKVVLAGAGGQRDLDLSPPSARSRQRPS